MARSSLVVDASAVLDGTCLNSAASLPVNDDRTYEIGPGCLLTTVFLYNTQSPSQLTSSRRGGIKGEEEEGEEEEEEANEEEAAALRALGLPVSFGTSKSYKGKRSSGGAGSSPSPSPSVEASPAKASSSSPAPPSPSKDNNNNKGIACMHYRKPGGCSKGDACPYAHGNADRRRARKGATRQALAAAEARRGAGLARGREKYPAVRRPPGSDPSAYRPPYHGRPYGDTNLEKYFRNRGWLWSHEVYDRGVKMDDDMWFSVTPFELARHHACRLLALESSVSSSSPFPSSHSSSEGKRSRGGSGGARRGPGRLVLDGFAGVGGDAAALAFAGARVVAVDLSLPRLEAARGNAELFFLGGVSSPPSSSSSSSSDVCGVSSAARGVSPVARGVSPAARGVSPPARGVSPTAEEDFQGGDDPDAEKCGEQTQQQEQEPRRHGTTGGLFDVVAADFFSVAPRMRVDCVFMSPPWGGPGYSGGPLSDSPEERYFRVREDVGGLGVGVQGLLAAAASAHAPAAPLDVAIFLPRSTFLPDLVEAAEGLGVCLEVERAVGRGKRASGVTAYFGASARRKG